MVYLSTSTIKNQPQNLGKYLKIYTIIIPGSFLESSMALSFASYLIHQSPVPMASWVVGSWGRSKL